MRHAKAHPARNRDLMGARQSSGNRKGVPPNRKAAGCNRQITGGIMMVIGSWILEART